ncbi:MarR family winged helix-turn-helix transcriptional regulator [Desulfobacca acetoxidans]|nr:MarR family transcriptional regulator [Desulfobacca acetoxidans]HAY23133.1 transcriptional regulator [Desulfobacterales bacterium]
MDTKAEYIADMGRKLMRILNKRARLEALRIRFDDGVELNPREIHTIQAIGEHRPINVTELAAYFGVTKSAASQIVSKLAEKGFVEKQHTANNNKELDLSLTELGWRAFQAHERFHGKHFAELVNRLGAFSLAQIATASVILDVIEDIVEERLDLLSKK